MTTTMPSFFFIILSSIIKLAGSSLEKTIIPTTLFFIFGDSIVDPGNNNYIETIPEFKANYPPYGQNGYFDRPTGRFTDGRVMVDFIAEYAKLPIIPAFMQPSASYINGANFASGGAGVLPETSQGLVINFQTQIKQFEKVSHLLAADLGKEPAREMISEAVYFISIGSNDYLFSYLLDEEKREAYSPEDFVAMVIGNLTQSIQELYEKGARKFYILSLSPLGCLPAFRAINPSADGGCFKDVSALAIAHNNALSAVLTGLEYILRGFKYANFDLYSWLDERIHHPSKYGFKDGMNACCGTGLYGGTYSCGGTKNVSDFQVCETPEDYVWWDSIHATERIHEQFAKAMWKDLTSIGEACNLEDLFLNKEKVNIGYQEDEHYNLGDTGFMV